MSLGKRFSRSAKPLNSSVVDRYKLLNVCRDLLKEALGKAPAEPLAMLHEITKDVHLVAGSDKKVYLIDFIQCEVKALVPRPIKYGASN